MPCSVDVATMCHLGAISAKLGPSVKFDPAAENCGGDEDTLPSAARRMEAHGAAAMQGSGCRACSRAE